MFKICVIYFAIKWSFLDTIAYIIIHDIIIVNIIYHLMNYWNKNSDKSPSLPSKGRQFIEFKKGY